MKCHELKKSQSNLFVLLVFATFAGASFGRAQLTSVFTYQGQLRERGTNANGTYTLTFALYDAPSGGTPLGANTNTLVVANGLFSANLDFGAGAFDGAPRYLELAVQSGTNWQKLAPRTPVLPSPQAQFAALAATVTNGGIMNAQLAPNAVAAANIQANAITASHLATQAVLRTHIANGQVVKTLNGLTDSVTLAGGANVSLFANANALQISAGPPRIQVFGTNGTFVVPTNVTRIMVELWGKGGNGGNGNAYEESYTIYYRGGGGGGGGGYAANVFDVTPGDSYAVTVAGSWPTLYTTFGSLLSAENGDSGGSGSVVPGGGGHGGSATGGLFPSTGQAGKGGDSAGNGGDGGTAFHGGVGGWGGPPGSSGMDGRTPGGGGGGGGAPDVGSFGSTAGGLGGQGMVVVYY